MQLPRSLSCIDYDQHHSLFVLAADSNISISSNSYSARAQHGTVESLGFVYCGTETC